MKTYKQCGLAQGEQRTVGWIETRGCIVGASVEIDELGGLWEVLSVGDTVYTSDQLIEKQRMDRGSFGSIKGRGSLTD